MPYYYKCGVCNTTPAPVLLVHREFPEIKRHFLCTTCSVFFDHPSLAPTGWSHRLLRLFYK